MAKSLDEFDVGDWAELTKLTQCMTETVKQLPAALQSEASDVVARMESLAQHAYDVLDASELTRPTSGQVAAVQRQRERVAQKQIAFVREARQKFTPASISVDNARRQAKGRS